jgi:N-acetyl-gamma-glutamyl-phosphate reductase
VIAYPHGASAPLAAALLERGVRVVDLSADFRLRDRAIYEQWYVEHPHPELIDRAVYGLPELYRERIRGAELVACPGCYPTATLLALAPLAEAGVVGDVVVDAKSGVSGAGRTPTDATHFVAADENVTPYGVGAHRHMPEIDQELAALGAPVIAAFTPHLVPLDQGELVSCYVTPSRAIDQAELDALYRERYGAEPFIELTARPPGVRDVRDTNICAIHAIVDERTGKLLVFGAIDNLWKGTSSQAVQNLNLMFGLDEARGIA